MRTGKPGIVANGIKSRHPFTIDAFVLLPEHLHCIWTLSPGDTDYSMRWNGKKDIFPAIVLINIKQGMTVAEILLDFPTLDEHAVRAVHGAGADYEDSFSVFDISMVCSLT